jgi:hypothetical protein
MVALVTAIVAIASATAEATPAGFSGRHRNVPLSRLEGDVLLVEAPPDPKLVSMTRYLEADVMGSWAHAVKDLPTADYHDVATDIASVVDHHEDGVLLAALGYWEGARYAAYVDDGRCNDPAWRTSAEGRWFMVRWGDCDGGNAHSLWQIHPIIDPSSRLYASCSLQAISDRRGAARCALEIARASMTASSNLCGYTGEFEEIGCPKAEQRLTFTLEALAKHPFASGVAAD